MKRILSILILCMTFMGACARVEPTFESSVTLPPAMTEPTPFMPEATPSSTPDQDVDYWQYLSIEDILVYEQDGSSFIDASIISTYDGVLACVLDVEWTDEQGAVGIARLTDGTGREVLYLQKGENRVYGTVLTDMDIAMLPFTILDSGGPPVPLE